MPKSIYGMRSGGSKASIDMKQVAGKVNEVHTRLASILQQTVEEGANDKKASIEERVDLLRKMIHNMK